jgi:hypothetical protein
MTVSSGSTRRSGSEGSLIPNVLTDVVVAVEAAATDDGIFISHPSEEDAGGGFEDMLMAPLGGTSISKFSLFGEGGAWSRCRRSSFSDITFL